MWHQLVLHGIGGASVEQAKKNLSAEEYLQWCGYIERRGSLDWGVKLEVGFAMIALIISRATGNKDSRLEDFMPNYQAPEGTIEDVMGILSGAIKRG